MAEFEKFIEPLVEKEGGYRLVEVPGDRGGRTYAGISERSNPDWRGWALIERKAPPPELVRAVQEQYRSDYWTPLQAEEIQSDDIVEAMFSCAVLSGPRTAVKLAQACLGETPDGIMGPETLKALNGCDRELFRARFALARINRYREICNRRRDQSQFLLGWLNRVFGELGT